MNGADLQIVKMLFFGFFLPIIISGIILYFFPLLNAFAIIVFFILVFLIGFLYTNGMRRIDLNKTEIECSDCVGICCRYWSIPQDYYLKKPSKDELERPERFGGKAVLKKKLFGLVWRVYWILPKYCKHQNNETGLCNIWETRPALCRSYFCDTDEFIGLKKELYEKARKAGI